MRHGKKFNHLGRKPAHRKAMLSNMASSLIMEKRISTTIAKAKELRKYVEPLLTKSKTDDTNSRRVVFSYLQNKESVSELFNEVAEKIASRPGGYTRILKTGNRLGDNADMCVIELVDYNDALLTEAKPEKAKTRRSRRGKGDSDDTVTKTADKVVEEAAVEEAVIEDAVVEEVVEEKVEDIADEVPNEASSAQVEETTEEVVEEAAVEEAVIEDAVVEEVVEEKVEEITEEVVEEAAVADVEEIAEEESAEEEAPKEDDATDSEEDEKKD